MPEPFSLTQLHHFTSCYLPCCLYVLLPPSVLQPVLHSCCSNPLCQLPALHSVESLPSFSLFLPLLLYFFSLFLSYLALSQTIFFHISFILAFLFLSPSFSSSLSFLFRPHQRGSEISIQPQQAANAKAQADEVPPSSANHTALHVYALCFSMGKE